MNEEALKLTLSSSPHAHSPNSTRRIMLDVCIALLPALIGAIVFFGARALTLTALSVAGCVFFEWAYRRIMKKDNTTGDLSAVVTGILVAFVCPVTLPFWTILIGDFFAIVVVKQLFGGIGANIVNPALAARAFLFSWPLFMNTWVRSGVHVPAFSNPTTASLDGLTAATPMASLHVGAMPEASVLDLFLGRFSTTAIIGRNMGALSLSGRKVALGIASAILRFVALTLSITQTIFCGLEGTLRIGSTLFSFLKFRAQVFKFGVRSATSTTAARDRHSAMTAVV